MRAFPMFLVELLERITHLPLLTLPQPSRVTQAEYSFSVLPSGPIRSYSILSNIAAQLSPFGSAVRTLRRLSYATRSLCRRVLAAARSPGNGQVGRSDSEIGDSNQAEWRGLVRSSK
jgi:hypothetical protein